MEKLTSRITSLTRIRAGHARKLCVLTILTLLLSWPSPNLVNADAVDLDPNFGSGGKVTTDFGDFDNARALAIQPDGKIVAAGTRTFDFALARYNSDGSLDISFGNGGKVITDFFGIGFEQISSVALQPDGKIVAAGFTFSFPTSFDFALARYNSDGSLDTSFGNGGKVATDFLGSPFFAGHDVASAVIIQPDGKIIAAGSVPNPTRFLSQDFGLARYNSDGSLDTSFGRGGKANADFINFFNESGANDGARVLALQPDGKIVAAGYAYFDLGLARFNSDGSLDTSFGLMGKVVTDFLGSIDEALTIAIQPDGKIMIAGRAIDPIHSGDDLALARYNADGTPDTEYGTGGKVTTDFFGTGTGESGTGVNAIAFLKGGKILVAGRSGRGDIGYDFGLAQYRIDGSLDTNFGLNGKVVTDFTGFFDRALAVAIQPDGKIIAAGEGGPGDFALARYIVVQPFNLCIEDDSSSDILRINSTTGDYQFSKGSGGFVLGGTGTLIKKGGIVILQHNTSDRRVLAKIDTSVSKGTASIHLFSPGRTFTIIDRDTKDDACSAPGH